MKKLDTEEQEILEAFESGNLKRVTDSNWDIVRHKEYAMATLAKKRNSLK